METIRELWKRYFGPITPLPSGVLSYRSPVTVTPPYKLHLRIDSSGSGILILNASTVIHLNQTATEYVYHWIKETPSDQIQEQLYQRYRINKNQVLTDYQSLKDRIQALIETPDLDPEIALDFSRTEPNSKELSAPFRIDIALTYRTANHSSEQAGPSERVIRELITEEWKTVLQKAWKAGIPHVVFTGGEPTLRPDLDELVAVAESIGMVSGLVTDGLRLAEKKYLHQLLEKGLDHVMIILDPNEEQAWESVRDVINEDISTTIHLTLRKNNFPTLCTSLERLKSLGVKKLSLSATQMELKQDLLKLRNLAVQSGFNIVWNLPVPFATLNPVAIEMDNTYESQLGAGKTWIYLEPDSDVLAEQGAQEVWGNFLTQSWEEIWSHAK